MGFAFHLCRQMLDTWVGHWIRQVPLDLHSLGVTRPSVTQIKFVNTRDSQRRTEKRRGTSAISRIEEGFLNKILQSFLEDQGFLTTKLLFDSLRRQAHSFIQQTFHEFSLWGKKGLLNEGKIYFHTANLILNALQTFARHRIPV